MAKEPALQRKLIKRLGHAPCLGDVIGAVGRNNIELLKLFDKAGWDLLQRGPSGNRLVHTAAFHCSIDCLRYLLEHHRPSQVPRNDGGESSLDLACYEGRNVSVIALLEMGMDATGAPLPSFRWGRTPLHVACMCRLHVDKSEHAAVVRTLLEHNVPHSPILDTCLHSRTPLHICVENNMVECALALIRAGVDPWVRDDGKIVREWTKGKEEKSIAPVQMLEMDNRITPATSSSSGSQRRGPSRSSEMAHLFLALQDFHWKVQSLFWLATKAVAAYDARGRKRPPLPPILEKTVAPWPF